jgi:protein-S-isoprenylcysteine O-methyltransferase Ste14
MTDMIEAVLVTVLPALFLAIIFGGIPYFRQKKIEQEGEAPINRFLFLSSKYTIILLWGSMALASWGIGYSPVPVPRMLQLIALVFWFAGFTLMYLWRFTMGDSFRLGTPREDTRLKTDGLFRFSRNPMYVGVYATIVASSLYTLNPAVILLGVFVVAVHHAIILAEEEHMQKVFSREYPEYCSRVRRYV